MFGSAMRTLQVMVAAVLLAPLSALQTATWGASADTAVAATPASASTTQPSAPAKIEFTQELLPNGLHVIYAPLHQAPVVQVRVVYHVGSRDERPDRQGFAHMFEHMMFRGSAHVAPEEHMKLVGAAGGISNAFTSFDQTVYHDTLPSEHLKMALYLEADRMSSFKVSEEIYKTERKVVAEEWRMRLNRPYGAVFEQFLKAAFIKHSYRWTPIGNMDDLRAARVGELQDFFNTYYLPNNATLVIAGDIDVPATREMVKQYFGWIPAGPPVVRDIPEEPNQTAERRATEYDRVPLPRVMMGWVVPAYRSDDHDALALLGDILGGGDSSRLQRLLVTGENPSAVSVEAGEMKLEDAGVFTVDGTVMQGRNPDTVEKVLAKSVADVIANGVTPEEVAKARTQERIGLVHGLETCSTLAAQLGDEAVFGGDPNRVNTALQRLDRVTPADIQRVAAQYLTPQRATVLRVVPDPLGKAARAAATQAAMDTPVPPTTRPVATRVVDFPADYPTHATLLDGARPAKFEKGTEMQVAGVQVIVMPDARLPLVTWSLTTRTGSYADPAGKQGLSSLADEMLRHGAADQTFDQLNEDLESRGIELGASDGGDYSRLVGSCTTEQLDHAMLRTRQVLLSPTFPADEFSRLKEQRANELRLSLESPKTVATNELAAALYGADSPLGRSASPSSITSITLDDVKAAARRNFDPRGAVLIIAGDVTVEHGRELAERLLEGWKPSDAGPTVAYPAAPNQASVHIILVDRPGAKQASVRMGVKAYDIRDDEKFAGSIAGQILTAGIDSRLGRYVRAQRGLAYGVTGYFQPSRHGGAFIGVTDTAVESTADAIEAMEKVFHDMRDSDVTSVELAQAKQRVAGGMVMGMQTVNEQASLRGDGILNGYPIDYYDQYPARVGVVTAAQVRSVMDKYVLSDHMTIVVVAPADAVKSQLERLGSVKVIPMPNARESATTGPSDELIKPAK